MKKIVLSLLAALGFVSLLSAQELTVESFELQPTDLTAKIADKKDLNGDVSALVKIFVAQPTILVPESMRLGEIETPAPSEFWVFVPAGSRRIQINAAGYLPLRFAFPEPLETMRTYVLRLSRSMAHIPELRKYKIGDYYEENGKEGVVFAVDDSGWHGKIISLYVPEPMNWDEARAYCEGKGSGWWLPTVDEVLKIYKNKSVLSRTLREKKANKAEFDYAFWSSESYNKKRAWFVDVRFHKIEKIPKYFNCYVLTVCTF